MSDYRVTKIHKLSFKLQPETDVTEFELLLDKFDNVSFFFNINIDDVIDETLNVDLFFGNEGKLEDFDIQLARFILEANKYTTSPITGFFILAGDEYGEYDKYIVNPDSSVLKIPATIIFDENKGQVLPTE